MQKLRYSLIVFAIVIITAHLFLIDYNDLSWSENSGSYLGIISMITMIAAMVLSIRSEKNKAT